MKLRPAILCGCTAVAITAFGSQRDEQQPRVVVNPLDGQGYVWIPPGTFHMGCSTTDRACQDEECAGTAQFANETPRHRVFITRGFWMGQTEVTIGAYRRYAQATEAKTPEELVLATPERFRFRGFPQEDDHPMVYVAWGDAAQYCRWAGGRLPTEAEWEYAARAGSPAARYGHLDEIAWYADNSGPSVLDGDALWEAASSPFDFKRQLRHAGNDTHPAGRKMPNDFGLFDMLGNVWEYCGDWYGEKYYTVSLEKDPPGPSGGEFRVMRGGAWRNIRLGVRVSIRTWMLPDHRFDDIGFRCVRDVIPK